MSPAAPLPLLSDTRNPLPIETATSRPSPSPHTWHDDEGIPDLALPYAGSDVLLPSGARGTLLYSCPGCPPLPPGHRHRYVVPVAQGGALRPDQVVCYHVSWLRPVTFSTLLALRWGASWAASWARQGYPITPVGRVDAGLLAADCYHDTDLRLRSAVVAAVAHHWDRMDAQSVE